MIQATPDTLQELHRIREAIAKDQAELTSQQRVAHTRREAEIFLKEWGIALKEVLPPSRSSLNK